MKNSTIQWTAHTFNPWWGCAKLSPGCNRCYAEGLAKRFEGAIWGPTANRRFFGRKHWAEPVAWDKAAKAAGKRHRVFCASMCDIMEDRRVLDPARAQLFELIERTPCLDWLLLTKRPANFKTLLPAHWLTCPRPNVWLMATVEQNTMMTRILDLISVPAVIHGISYEPALDLLDLSSPLLSALDWIIVGGESGAGARPFDAAWAMDIVKRFAGSKTMVFVKQMGTNAVLNGQRMTHAGKKNSHGADWTQWPKCLQVRQVPVPAV
jgi:protein gp37